MSQEPLWTVDYLHVTRTDPRGGFWGIRKVALVRAPDKEIAVWRVSKFEGHPQMKELVISRGDAGLLKQGYPVNAIIANYNDDILHKKENPAMRPTDPIKCAKCGTVDVTRRIPATNRLGYILHVGTSKTMSCPDCGDFFGKATYCRNCCPSGHSTRGFGFENPLTVKGKKILDAMKHEYGAKKGTQVFYASKNKGTITGVEKGRENPFDEDAYERAERDHWERTQRQKNLTVITFPPGAVDKYIALALELGAGISVKQYYYDKTGSKVAFTPRQFTEFMDYLRDVMTNQEYVSVDEKAELKRIYDLSLSQVQQTANPLSSGVMLGLGALTLAGVIGILYYVTKPAT